MKAWVSWMGSHDIVERHAWFTGRWPGNPHTTDLSQDDALSAAQGDGVPSALGQSCLGPPVGE